MAEMAWEQGPPIRVTCKNRACMNGTQLVYWPRMGQVYWVGELRCVRCLQVMTMENKAVANVMKPLPEDEMTLAEAVEVEVAANVKPTPPTRSGPPRRTRKP